MSPDEYRAAQWYTDPTDALYPGDDRWRLEDREAYAQGVRLALKNIELKIDRLLERLG